MGRKPTTRAKRSTGISQHTDWICNSGYRILLNIDIDCHHQRHLGFTRTHFCFIPYFSFVLSALFSGGLPLALCHFLDTFLSHLFLSLPLKSISLLFFYRFWLLSIFSARDRWTIYTKCNYLASN